MAHHYRSPKAQKAQYYMDFNGTSTYFRVPPSLTFNRSAFTLAWHISPATNTYSLPMYYSPTMAMYQQSGQLWHLFALPTAWSHNVLFKSYSLNEDIHYCLVKRPTAYHILINGVIVSTINTTMQLPSSSYSMQVGAWGFEGVTASDYFRGKMRDFVMYNEALSDADILKLSQGKSVGTPYLWLDPQKTQTDNTALTNYGSAGGTLPLLGVSNINDFWKKL